MDASKGEPMPKSGGVNIMPEVIKDLKARDRVGTKKYGTTLQSNNGRNCLMDAYQEALDLVMYLKQALIEQAVSQPRDLADDCYCETAPEHDWPCKFCRERHAIHP